MATIIEYQCLRSIVEYIRSSNLIHGIHHYWKPEIANRQQLPVGFGSYGRLRNLNDHYYPYFSSLLIIDGGD